MRRCVRSRIFPIDFLGLSQFSCQRHWGCSLCRAGVQQAVFLTPWFPLYSGQNAELAASPPQEWRKREQKKRKLSDGIMQFR